MSLGCFETWVLPCWTCWVWSIQESKPNAVGVSEDRSPQHDSLLLQNNRQIWQVTLPSFSLCKAGTIFRAFTTEGSSWFKHLGRTTKESSVGHWCPYWRYCLSYLVHATGCSLGVLHYAPSWPIGLATTKTLPSQHARQSRKKSTNNRATLPTPNGMFFVQRLSDQSQNFQSSLYQIAIFCHGENSIAHY